MNQWRQTRFFICAGCGETYVHDRGYAHNLFQCANRAGLASTTSRDPGRAIEINQGNPLICGGFTNPVGCGVASFFGEGEMMAGDRR